jgi:hypothetical protein
MLSAEDFDKAMVGLEHVHTPGLDLLRAVVADLRVTHPLPGERVVTPTLTLIHGGGDDVA